MEQNRLDVFRILLLTCRNEDLNYGMKHQLLTQENLLKAGLGKEFYSKIAETAKRVFRGIRIIRFLTKLGLTVNLMKRVRYVFIASVL